LFELQAFACFEERRSASQHNRRKMDVQLGSQASHQDLTD
jgi:hypothetical protein